MDIDFIPFRLGVQYENWEFDLEPDFESSEFDRYLYVKNDIKTLFDIPIERIYLSFNADILFMIEYEFDAKYFEALKSILLDLIHKSTFQDFGDSIAFKDETCLVALVIKSDNLILRQH